MRGRLDLARRARIRTAQWDVRDVPAALFPSIDAAAYCAHIWALTTIIPPMNAPECTPQRTPALRGLAATLLVFAIVFVRARAPAGLEIKEMAPDRLVIAHGGAPVAEYVFKHDKVFRPFFANVRLPDGVQLTRNFPPIEGRDATDHGDMHPGIAFGFGDISSEDLWRNKGRIEHVGFIVPPDVHNGTLAFTTKNHLLSSAGAVLAQQVSAITLAPRAGGWLLTWDATFTPTIDGFYFGDQEEMGFAVRVATPIAEKNGGLVINSDGVKGAKKAWGQAAAWCDYSGTPGGIAIIADPRNLVPSWWHTRDYGVFVANPFGRKAMKQGAASRIDVKRGDMFRLRFAAFLHGPQVDIPAACTEILHRMKDAP
jgi:hypothetical protein